MDQPRIKRLSVFGCSLTKDNHIETWADILAATLNVSLNNYAERGAGYSFIEQKVFSTEITDDELVVIMWPSADRLDLYVNDATPHLQSDISNASWLDGKKAMFVDYQGNYNNSNGWYLSGAVPRGYKHHYYKFFYNQTTHINQAWTSIIAVQNYLDNNNIQYVMCNSFPLRNLIQYHNDGIYDANQSLYNRINLDKFVTNAESTGFITLSKLHKFSFINAHYPDSASHCWYVDSYLNPKIMHDFSI
jgi:hypothetical protein